MSLSMIYFIACHWTLLLACWRIRTFVEIRFFKFICLSTKNPIRKHPISEHMHVIHICQPMSEFLSTWSPSPKTCRLSEWPIITQVTPISFSIAGLKQKNKWERYRLPHTFIYRWYFYCQVAIIYFSILCYIADTHTRVKQYIQWLYRKTIGYLWAVITIKLGIPIFLWPDLIHITAIY